MGTGSHSPWMAVALGVLLAASGCVSTAPENTGRAPDPRDGAASLQRPLTGDMAALYRMRSPRTGGLRLAVTTRGRAGRIVLARQLGGPLLIAAWDPPAVHLLDLDSGCEQNPARAARILGLGSLPLSAVPLILGGRLPPGRLAEDDAAHGWVTLVARGWRCRVRLAADPWRAVTIETPDGTRVELSHHTASVPGKLRIVRPDGHWFVLELARLEWDANAPLPPLPELPPCEEPGG